ncbi:MAG TPA: lipid-A-disaccharide synthase [Pyrinomonadaceae bacterium]|nr:lipid-A-disaccharide synthase [Pyrinomonadaceae bacterium]
MENDKWKMSSLRLMIVAGEASGDAHGASLINALREVAPQTNFEFFGATGAQMRSAGVESIVDTDKLSILGLWEIASALPGFLSAYRKLKRAAIARKPDAVILIDWPDFNLRLARWLHRRGVRVIYYVSPQLWAWRSYRARNIRRDVDLLLSILPFEKEWYATRGMAHVEYVGHPLAGNVHASHGREEFCLQHELDATKPIISLLPGSRHKELARILPPMLDAAGLLSRTRTDVQFVVVVAPNRDPKEAEEIASTRQSESLPRTMRIIHHETREALLSSDAAAIASGTATLEAALLGTPMVIVYKESFLNWHALGSMISVDHYGLVNLIAGRRVATELMQKELNGERLSRELLELLEPDRNREFRRELAIVSEQLGAGGATRLAAEKILEFLSPA